jgi:hypothetical protein
MVLSSAASASFACVAPANLSLPAPGDDGSSVGDDAATTPDSPAQETGSGEADASDGASPDAPSSDGAGGDAGDEASTFVCPALVGVGFGTEGCPCTSPRTIACPESDSVQLLVCAFVPPVVGAVYRGPRYVWQDGGACPASFVCDPQHAPLQYPCTSAPVPGDDGAAPDATVEDAGTTGGSSSGGPGGPGTTVDAGSPSSSGGPGGSGGSLDAGGIYPPEDSPTGGGGTASDDGPPD